MNYFFPIGVALLAIASSIAMAAPKPDFGSLAGLIQKTKEHTAHPSGTAIAVLKDGKVVYEGYFGFSDISAQTQVTGDTVFYIASATKPFFALNALLKEEAGQLDRRTSLQQMFPDIHFSGIHAKAVTIENLLGHTSGIDNQPLVWATAFSGVHDARSRRALVAASYPNAEIKLGSFMYTNVGYNILSVWLDTELAMPWQDQLDRAIFEPLKMAQTTAYISKAQVQDWPLATPYSFASLNPSEPLYLRKADSTLHAAGGLVSTAPDLAKFLLVQLGAGKYKSSRIFPKSVVRNSHISQAKFDASYLDFKRTGYAWGWYSGDYKGKSMRHAFGAFPGFHAHLSFMPTENIGLVVLNNEDAIGARMTNLIADYVYGILLEEPGIDAKVSQRFSELKVSAKEMQRALAKHRAEIQGRPSSLSQPLEAYVGVYTSELLGTMTIELDKNTALLIRFGNLAAVATGYAKTDYVRVEFSPNSGDFLSFALKDGRVDSLAFNHATFKKAQSR